MLTVFEPTAPRWQTALAKAETHSTNRVTFSRTMAHEGESTDAWIYGASATAEGEHYSVVVSQYQGDRATQGGCKAGEFGGRCWHAAAALERLGLVPSPAPVADVVQMPTRPTVT